ncbi:anti-sigma factor [Salinicola aestuarinus]|uniref:anti-sigma factor n=1 Tax=Salinicola aestuarinus TaxID=1949082 RepID=UPI000DA1FBBC|nr:anti-sigma factor [Salinicola aestuarinus]
MHDTSGLSDPEVRDLAAGEYVLGTLNAADSAAFEAVLAVSHDLQRQVDAWRERLQLLNDELEPVTPPDNVWTRVRARLPVRERPARHSRWQRAGVWCSATALATAAALALAVLVFSPSDDSSTLGNYVFAATAPNQQMGWVVNASSDGQMQLLALAPGGMPDGKGCELWMMDDGEPVSLGMLPLKGEVVMQLPERLMTKIDGADLMITMEPSAGSPNGKPTGAIMDRGKLTPKQGKTVLL